MRKFLVIAALAMSSTALADGGLTLSGSIYTLPNEGLMFSFRATGVTKPKGVSEDYRRAVCDIGGLLGNHHMITVNYDDGSVEFDCARDLPAPK